ncbi:MAG: RagB/SusD family nutrient uptake outer membrane protein [Cytophagales bacterium]|nr:RagB/SusD family nutrient uptake outer membrane protein [Bernardetiaceae bacterium]MDW8204962.1 RagB/SusD family nutrient uptake outer membrane protein [Cytophagales bacterium]
MKIRQYVKISLLSVFASMAVTSCNQNKILEPVPLTALSDRVAFATPDRILAQLNGLYASVKSGQFLGGRMLVYMDVRGEDFQNRTGNGVTALFAWSYNQNSSNAEPLNAWSAGYLAINRINVFLKGLDDNPNVISATLANQYRGEARFLRAMCYYYLVNLYARPFPLNNGASPGLPLRLQAEVGPENSDLARSTVAQVYNQILEDLNFAEQNVLATHPSALLNVTRAHRNAVIAFKIRVLMSMARYADAVTECRKIVSGTTAPFAAPSGVQHRLAATYASIFVPPYTTAESIFSFPMTLNDLPGVQNGLGSYFGVPAPPQNAIADFNLDPAGILNNPAWTAGDARRALTAVAGGRTFLTKFPLNPYTDYVPILRYSEVLLNYAESLVRSTNTVDPLAIALLNAVRGRSAPNATYTSFATPAEFLQAISLERRIEFLGEGLRSLDLHRLLLPLPAKTGVPGSVAPTDANYIWPIPDAELAANKLMTQN